MALEAHYSTGNRREPKRSWTKRHREEARLAARTRAASKIIAAFYNREEDQEKFGRIRTQVDLVVYLDHKEVLSHHLYGYTPQRRHQIFKIVCSLMDEGVIVIGARNEFWLQSQIDAEMLLERQRSEVVELGMSRLKQENVKFLQQKSEPLVPA